MGIGEQQGRANLVGILLGVGLAALFVAVNGFAAFNLIPSSYQQFSWEAYASVVYTSTATPSSTPTETPTATATPSVSPTATPTVTPKIPNGGSCATGPQCQSGFCVKGTCCNTICNQAGQVCTSGQCTNTAPVPAVSNRSLVIIVVLMIAVGFFALTPLRFGKRR